MISQPIGECVIKFVSLQNSESFRNISLVLRPSTNENLEIPSGRYDVSRFKEHSDDRYHCQYLGFQHYRT